MSARDTSLELQRRPDAASVGLPSFFSLPSRLHSSRPALRSQDPEPRVRLAVGAVLRCAAVQRGAAVWERARGPVLASIDACFVGAAPLLRARC